MTCTLKCRTCNIVIDELLAYIQNKISIADEESLVRICVSTFSSDQIENSNALLFESLPSNLRKSKRKGKGKENRVLSDIINVFKITDPDVMPVFVARDLEKLPPITFDHLDVSKLLKDLALVQNEIKNIKSSYVTQDQLEDMKKECQYIEPPPFSAVNMKRGAYRESGPIGLSLMNDTLIYLESDAESVQEPLSSSLKYRDININHIEGSTKTPSPTGKYRLNGNSSSAGGGDEAEGNTSPPRTSDPDNTNDQLTDTRQQSYASAAKPTDEWIVVQNKRQKPKNRFVGKMGSVIVEKDEKFKAADRKVPIFITNVHKNTSKLDIINYIQKKTKDYVLLEKISIKRKCEHDAYKFFVPEYKVPLYLDDKMWPKGIIFRRFVHFKNMNKTGNGTENKNNGP